MTLKQATLEAIQLIKYYIWELEQECNSNDWDGAERATARIGTLADDLNELIVESTIKNESVAH